MEAGGADVLLAPPRQGDRTVEVGVVGVEVEEAQEVQRQEQSHEQKAQDEG